MPFCGLGCVLYFWCWFCLSWVIDWLSFVYLCLFVVCILVWFGFCFTCVTYCVCVGLCSGCFWWCCALFDSGLL